LYYYLTKYVKLKENCPFLKKSIKIGVIAMYVLDGNRQYLNNLYDYLEDSGNSAQSVLLF